MRDRIYLHVTWVTRSRAPLIDGRIAQFLARFLPAVGRQERCVVLELNIVSTHVHLLIQMPPTASIPRLLQRLKGGSAVIASQEGHARVQPLRWDKGYSIESVSPGAIDKVRGYIRNQQERHPAEVIGGWPEADNQDFPPSLDAIVPSRS